MASIRRGATGNSILYRHREPDGRQIQRTVFVGPAETLAGGREYFEARIADLQPQIEELKYGTAADRRERFSLMCEAERAAEALVRIERAVVELGADA